MRFGIPRKPLKIDKKPLQPCVTLEQIYAFEPDKPETFTPSPLLNSILDAMHKICPLSSTTLGKYLDADPKKLTAAVFLITGMEYAQMRELWGKNLIARLREQHPKWTADQLARAAGYSSNAAVWRTENRIKRKQEYRHMQDYLNRSKTNAAAAPKEFKIIVITRPDFFEGEAEKINELFHTGLQLLHIRKPGADEEQVKCLIAEIDKRFWSRIVLHDHFELAERAGLCGIHLGKGREGSYPHTSYSCHSFQEVVEQKPLRDYVFLSPIFDSISKEGYHAAFTQEDLLAAKAKGIIDNKVIALGGITPDNLPQVKQLGFGGIALLGSIWQSATPVAELAEFLLLSRQYSQNL